MVQIFEDLTDFRNRMGCEYLSVTDSAFGNWRSETGQLFLFENGGRSSGQVHQDPPADQYERLGLQKLYYTEKSKRLQKEFEGLQKHIVDAASNHRAGPSCCPPPSPALNIELKRLAQHLHATREKLAEINAELERLRPVNHAQQFAERNKVESTRRAASVANEALAVDPNDPSTFVLPQSLPDPSAPRQIPAHLLNHPLAHNLTYEDFELVPVSNGGSYEA